MKRSVAERFLSRHDHVGHMTFGRFEAVCDPARGGCGQRWASLPTGREGRRWEPLLPGQDTEDVIPSC